MMFDDLRPLVWLAIIGLNLPAHCSSPAVTRPHLVAALLYI